ncbi:MAG: molybdopterin-dependent oxidoreductase [Hyphomicrobium sp.]|nr:molybdopterin-dependent oxidoreductase [Hyphomicrobium sp.]
MAAERHESVSRRRFLGLAGAGIGSVIGARAVMAEYRYLAPVSVENPLAAYPNRDWERIYRDIYRTDQRFTFLCCPNDTHNCLLNAQVKNNVVVRIEPTYGYSKAQDLYGNKASARWDPRCCQKGLVLARRFYGDRRVNGAFLRKGFKDWVDQGFPRDPATGAAPRELMRRGWDSWVKVSHEEAAAYHAKTLLNIAQTYSGDEGKKRLLVQGYDPDMVEAVGGAGTRVMKFRGGMAKQGAIRIFGAFRMGNTMALLDQFVRKVADDDAKGSGCWDSYSFHTDLPPGHPMVTGEQTNDFELFDTENANVIVAWGMNWITTKMPDSHWLTEARLKGAKTVAVTVEYSATASKCDDVIVIRPGTDPAFALGVAQVMMAEKLYNADFVKRYTDMPTLVRMDTLERLKASDVFPGYENKELTNFVSYVAKDQKAPPTTKQNGMQIPEALSSEFGDFVMWDSAKKGPVAVSRDAVGERFAATVGFDPALEGTFEITLADGKKVEARTVFDLTKEYLDANMTPAQSSKICWAPKEAIVSLARTIAASEGRTLIACGMGPNQFWNNDNKDRALFLCPGACRIARPPWRQHRLLRRQLQGHVVLRHRQVDGGGSFPSAARPQGRDQAALHNALRVDALLGERRAPSEGWRQEDHNRRSRADPDQVDLAGQLQLLARQPEGVTTTSSTTRCRNANSSFTTNGGGRRPASIPTSSMASIPGWSSSTRT